jgi:tetraacyldisaccharide 4'-kinase
MNVKRPWLLPLVPVYAAGLAVKRWMVKRGWLMQRRLRYPVVSVGSVSAGGAGKTPMVLLLAELMERSGYAVRILTRGYGRQSQTVERVEPEGDPAWFGDEPVLLAQRSDAEVFVGADRYEAGLLAAREVPEGKTIVYLLDDGYQHGALARDIDIVLLTKQDTEDVLLPAGDLREPLTAVRQADILVLREEELAWTEDFVVKLTREGVTPLLWVIRRRLFWPANEGARMPQRPLMFCGLARPEGFAAMLEAEGCRTVGAVTFRDHHAYTEQDVAELVERARMSGADGFVTTEKDAVKLSAGMWQRLEPVGPLAVARLRVELVDEKAKMEEMILLVGRMERRRH